MAILKLLLPIGRFIKVVPDDLELVDGTRVQWAELGAGLDNIYNIYIRKRYPGSHQIESTTTYLSQKGMAL